MICGQSQYVDIPEIVRQLQDKVTADLREGHEEKDTTLPTYGDINHLEKKALTQTFDQGENQVRVRLTSP